MTQAKHFLHFTFSVGGNVLLASFLCDLVRITINFLILCMRQTLPTYRKTFPIDYKMENKHYISQPNIFLTNLDQTKVFDDGFQ